MLAPGTFFESSLKFAGLTGAYPSESLNFLKIVEDCQSKFFDENSLTHSDFVTLSMRRYDFQHNDIQHNDTQHNNNVCLVTSVVKLSAVFLWLC